MGPHVILSVVLNVHREGLWAYKAMRSAVEALRKFMKVYGPESCEIVVIADKADQPTLDAINAVDHGTDLPVRVIETLYGDLGMARNEGVKQAHGDFVAFLDGDDVWGALWPQLAVTNLLALAELHPGYRGRFIAHPCMNVDFGDGAFWWSQPDQRQADFNPGIFWNTNCWSSGSLSPRALLLEHPYRARGKGLGFEDWEWNARTLAAGMVHVSIADAVVFIRKKSDGLNVESARKHQLIAHSPYFECDPKELPTHDALGKVQQPTITEASLYAQWKAAHLIEPDLWPDARQIQDLPRYEATPVNDVPGLARAIVRRMKGVTPTHVILAPHLVQGGADKRIVAYAESVVRCGGKPAIILTDRDGDGSWEEHLPDDVVVIDAASQMTASGSSTAVLALARVLMQWKPVLHIINSGIGYGMLRYYGHALRESGVPRIFCSLYGSEARKLHDGSTKLGGAAFNGWFFHAREHFDMVISDNGAHQRELAHVHGWPRTKTITVPSVVRALTDAEFGALSLERGISKSPMIRVLWASRIVRGKRLDRLLGMAKLSLELKLPIVFAVAGETGDSHSKRWAAELRKLSNVKLTNKSFDGWKDLVPGKVDMFVFTSESEGMPNVVLEAMGYGLKVVSTDVGGVAHLPYVVKVREQDADNPEAWIKAIMEPATVEMLKGSISWIREHNSIDEFDRQMRKAGYYGTDEDDRQSGVDGEVENENRGAAQA